MQDTPCFRFATASLVVSLALCACSGTTGKPTSGSDAATGNDAATGSDAATGNADASAADGGAGDAGPTATLLGEGDITTAGGVVTGGAVKLTFPAGAVASTQHVTVKQLDMPPAQLPAGMTALASFQLDPSGVSFANPAVLEIAIERTGVPAGPYANGVGLALLHFDGGRYFVAGAATGDATKISASVSSFSVWIVTFMAPSSSCALTVTAAVGQGGGTSVVRTRGDQDPDYAASCNGQMCSCTTSDPVARLSASSFTNPAASPANADEALVYARASYLAGCGFPCAYSPTACSNEAPRTLATAVQHSVSGVEPAMLAFGGGRLRDGLYAVSNSTTMVRIPTQDDSHQIVHATVRVHVTAESNGVQSVQLDRREALTPIQPTGTKPYDYSYRLTLQSDPVAHVLNTAGPECPASFPMIGIGYGVGNGALVLGWPTHESMGTPRTVVRRENLFEICDNITLTAAPGDKSETIVNATAPAAAGGTPVNGEYIIDSVTTYSPGLASDRPVVRAALRITNQDPGHVLLERVVGDPPATTPFGRSRLVLEVSGNTLAPVAGQPQCGEWSDVPLPFTWINGFGIDIIRTSTLGWTRVEHYRDRTLPPTLHCNSLDAAASNISVTETALAAPIPNSAWTGFPAGKSWADYAGEYHLTAAERMGGTLRTHRVRFRLFANPAANPCQGSAVRMDYRDDDGNGSVKINVRCIGTAGIPPGTTPPVSFSYFTAVNGADCSSDENSVDMLVSGGPGAGATIQLGNSTLRETYTYVGP